MLTQTDLINLLHQDADLAVGCTEPVMVALAVAKAREILAEEPRRIKVFVSPAVWKNARCVGLPGINKRGLTVAAALGIFANAEDGQQLLARLKPEGIAKAEKLIEDGAVTVAINSEVEGVFARAKLSSNQHEAEVEIKGNHKSYTFIRLDNTELIKTEENNKNGQDVLADLKYEELLTLVLNLPEIELGFLIEGAQAIITFTKEIIKGQKKPLAALSKYFLYQAGLAKEIYDLARAMTGIAVAERMAGALYPVLTSAGSGNQGILVAVPLLLLGQKLMVGQVKIGQALAIAHFTNMYIRAFTGKLSPLCGAVSGGAGVAAASCWLLGGNKRMMVNAIQNLLGNLCCILCDGAKDSCALKISTAATEGLHAAQMAYQGINLETGAGILNSDLETTLGRLRDIIQEGLGKVDNLLSAV